MLRSTCHSSENCNLDAERPFNRRIWYVYSSSIIQNQMYRMPRTCVRDHKNILYLVTINSGPGATLFYSAKYEDRTPTGGLEHRQEEWNALYTKCNSDSKEAPPATNFRVEQGPDPDDYNTIKLVSGGLRVAA